MIFTHKLFFSLEREGERDVGEMERLWKQGNCCISSSDSLGNMCVFVPSQLCIWCFPVWLSFCVFTENFFGWMKVFVCLCVSALDRCDILTFTNIFPSALPGLSLPTWQCNSPLEPDCSTHPLVSNERIRHYIFVRIPPVGVTPASTLVRHTAAFMGLCGLIEYLLACWHIQSRNMLTRAYKTSKRLHTPTHVGTKHTRTHKPRLHTAEKIFMFWFQKPMVQ